MQKHVRLVGGLLVEELLDVVLHLVGVLSGRESVDWDAIAIYKELGEVPLDGRAQDVGDSGSEVGEDGVSLLSVDFDLGHHVEGDIVLLQHSGFDFVVLARFL